MKTRKENYEVEANPFKNKFMNLLLQKAEPPVTSSCCIYRVPFPIHTLNQHAYTPKVIYIALYRLWFYN